MKLPKTKTKPVDRLEEQIILIHGRPKIGKSTFASQFENPLFLATEPGLKSLETFQVIISNWSDMWDSINALKNDEHDFKTAVIDTVDNAWMWCEQYIVKQWNLAHDEKEVIIHISDLQYGKGTHLVRDEFRRAIVSLLNLGLGLIMISHSEDKEFLNRVRTVTTLPGTARRVVEGLADIILYATIKGDKRVLYTKPSGDHTAGDRTGRLSEIVDLNYEKFLLDWYGGDDNQINEKVKGAVGYLKDKQIDGFEVEKRIANSLEKHLGIKTVADLSKAPIAKKQSYIRHLKEKALKHKKENGNGITGHKPS